MHLQLILFACPPSISKYLTVERLTFFYLYDSLAAFLLYSIYSYFSFMDNDFTVIVPCKRYVKAYLEKHCGNPVDLNFLDLQYDFRKYLKRRDIPLIPRFYPVTVKIRISEDDFYRNGFCIDPNDVLRFNKEIEQLIKYQMHIYLLLRQVAGGTVPDAIEAFQNLYEINESEWNSESMKKDFDRNGCSFIPKELKAMKARIKINLLKQYRSIYG